MDMHDLSSPAMTPECEVEVVGMDLGEGEESGRGMEVFDGEIESPAAEGGLQEQVMDQGEDQDREDRSVLVKGDGSVFGEAGVGGSKEVQDQEARENELPVLRESSVDEDSVKGKKVLRTEIPDSEADTEEAVSPVKSDVSGGRAQVSGEANWQDADGDGLVAGPRGDEDHNVEADRAGEGMEVDSSTALVNEDISPSLENEVLPANAVDDEVPTATLNDESTHHEQKAEGESLPTNLVLDDGPSASSNDETTQLPTNETVSTNAVHQASDPVSFVDDGSMIIFSQITTFDSQPMHTQTQTQTQEEDFVGSHFADAVAVMSDVGGGTQDLMSSNDDAGGKNGDAIMQSSGDMGGGTQLHAESAVISEQVSMDGDMDKDDGGPDLHLPERVPSETAVETVVEPVSLKKHTVQDASKTEPPADQEDVSISMPPEEEDTVMNDESLQHHETEAKDGKISPVHNEETTDVEMHSDATDLKSTRSIAARSIPDSDDDEELPDAEPISKEVEDSQATLPIVSQSAIIELVESNEKNADVTETASLNKSTSESKLPPKRPNTSFKPPSLSTTTESQSTEPSSSPSKPEVTTSTPSKADKERKKEITPPKLLTASDVSQNKDILMAELKAIKIASIQARNASLEAEIKKKKARLEEVTKELKYPAAETVKNHIKLLHDYNDIRDVGQGLVGMIADNRGVRIGELYEEFGVGLKD